MPTSPLAPAWAHTSLGGLNKMLNLVQQVNGRVDSVSLISSELMLMILLQEPQDDKWGSRLWTSPWPRLLGILGQVTFLSEAYSLVCKIKEMKTKNKAFLFPRTIDLPLNVDTTGLPWCCAANPGQHQQCLLPPSVSWEWETLEGSRWGGGAGSPNFTGKTK